MSRLSDIPGLLRNKSLFILFLFLLPLLLAAQNPNLYNFSLSQGLPSSEVYSAYQDKKGFIWFATDNGVARFDGNEIETFNTHDGLVDPVVFSFHEDEQDRLWFRTYSGNIAWFKDDEITAYEGNEKLTSLIGNDLISSMYVNNDTLWFSTARIIANLANGKETIADVTTDRELVCRKVDGEYLLASNSVSFKIKFVTINGKKFSVTLSDTTYHHKVINALEWNGELFISINNNLFGYDGNTLKKRFTGRGPIARVYIDKKNHLWIGYIKGGVERYAQPDFQNPLSFREIENKSVTSVLEDNEGGIWLTTLESGVYYASNLDIEFFPIDPDNKVTSVFSTGDQVLTGSENGFVNVYSSRSKKIIQRQHFDNGPIYSIYQDRHKKFWISTEHTYLIPEIGKKPLREYSLRITAFAEVNDFIWAVGGLSLTKFSPNGEAARAHVTPYRHRSIFAEDSIVYLTERLGVMRYDSMGREQTYPLLKHFKISHISSLNDSTRLITTIGNGIVLLNIKRQTIHQFHTGNNFVIDNVYHCIPTDTIIWLGTEKGIIAIEKNSLLHDEVVFKQLTQKGGLKNNKTDFMVLTKNEVWAFSSEGFTTIPISLFNIKNIPPKFYLKKLIVNDKAIPYKKEMEFSYNQNNMELLIGYIGFNNQTITCRYRLFDKDSWKYTTGRNIQLPSLSFGKYNMTLEYSTNNAEWIDSHIDFKFSISPPVWARWDFIVILLTVLLLTGYFILLRSEKQKNQRLAELYLHQQKLLNVEINTLENERGRISKDLHDGVGSNLVVLKMKIYRFISLYSQEFAREIEQQFQDTITEIRRILYELTPPGLEKYGLLSSLQPYIEKIKQDTNLEIEFHASGNEFEESRKSTLVFRIIQELISNTVKHSNASKITLHVNSFESELNIIYQDNGTGFDAGAKQNGHGLHNIESRIKALEGNFQIDSGNFGVSFIISIPVKQKV